MDIRATALAIAIIAAAIWLYTVPSQIAGKRNHRNTTAIVGLNLLLGWTVLGWIIALVWSLSDNVKPEPERSN